MLVLKVCGFKVGLIGGAPYLSWLVGLLNWFFAFSSNRPWAWHGDFDWFEVKKSNEKENDEDWKRFWDVIRLKNGLRRWNLEREKIVGNHSFGFRYSECDVKKGFERWFWIQELMGNNFYETIWIENEWKWWILEWERMKREMVFRERMVSGLPKEGGRWTTFIFTNLAIWIALIG